MGLRPARQALPRRPRGVVRDRRSVTAAPSSPTPRPSRPASSRTSRCGATRIPRAIELAERLAELAPGDLDRVFFTTGGSEAVESAWKLARQYFHAIGQPNRYKVISRYIAYHGTTMGALSITGVPAIKPAVRAARARRDPRAEHELVPAGADRSRRGDRARDRDAKVPRPSRRCSSSRCRTRAAASRRRRLLPTRARDLRRDRRAARLRRGDLRVRPARPLVRFRALRLPARHHHDGEGHDVGLLADRRHDRAPAPRRAVPQRRQHLPARHHVRRPPVSSAVALANLDLIEREGLLEHVRENEGAFRATLEQAARSPDRRRRARRRLLLRHRARQGQGDEGDVQRRRERTPPARLPLATRCTTRA